MALTTARCAKALQLTLAVIKPDAVAHPLVLEALHEKILENNFIIVKAKETVWRRKDSERFYAEHKGRFFYQRLVEFMSSGPMWAYILAREEAVSHWRAMMGPTKVFRARYDAPGSIRARFGLTDTRNTTHGSDSEDSAWREIAFFFPEFSVAEWMERAEPAFRAGPVEYDPHRRMHTLLGQHRPKGPLETDPQHRPEGAH
ncbi:nucleoside diphosphate kinase 6 isoform X1 [Anguilla anguilla]|uniref:nucleoside diphosphate kinase 6 isoform X1 n=1 Tax=Anguilla anguilla TaxID=7936 RepID=UPI0015ABD794|nr:nucleoside diphosphate kinase 6 isoform X1 [Anguilla anguilla]XP_035276734.1 nucleoside diphosphate kinase 6 isoform X1 [Anguilla anguilla]XP_035276735.1 nucleoside diphosphate kinase 6 isoform X1 [Anguilla anguilla]XP_035276736.1 nucleoside diphosphate kinase 6 isoform X1 [Anguilla anguilla]